MGISVWGHPMLIGLALSFLCEWNQILWRKLRTLVLPWDFFMYSYVVSTNSHILWICGSINLDTVLIFRKNFLDFRLNMIEKKSIINLSSYSSKSYAPVVRNDSDLSFLEEEKDAAFHSLLYCVLFIHRVALWKKYVIKFPCLSFFR